jgi:hypothetical protein
MSQSNRSYSIERNKINIGNNELEFRYPIIEHVEISEMLIIRLVAPDKDEYNENVFGISLNEARTEWQIAKRESTLKYCAYIKIRVFEGRLILINWCSFYLYVNPLNGEILEEGFTK